MSEFLIDQSGCQVWYDLKSYKRNYTDGIIHMICFKNEPIFYIQPHREDGPAKIWLDEREEYWIKGKRHREDGPAIIFKNGNFWWCLDGYDYSFKSWCEKLNKSEEEINFLRLKWNIS